MSKFITTLTTGSVGLLTFGSFLLWYILSSIRSWYRLRHIPGPSFLTSFTYLWLARTTYSGKQYWVHRDLHKNLGPLVRIGPNEIMTDDPEILKKIASTRSIYHRDPWYTTGRFNPYYINMFTILEPAAYTKARMKTIPAYSGRETPALEPGVDDQIKTLIDLLRRKYMPTSGSDTTPLVDLALLSNYFTMDVITRAAFGHEFGYLKDETDHYNVLGIVRELWPLISVSGDIPWIRQVLFSKLFLRLFGPKPSDKRGFGALMGVAKAYVIKRFRFAPDAKEEHDMLGSFIRHGLNQQACEAEGLFMVLAGSESSASAIRTALIHTMSTPRVYRKLKEEVKLAINEGRASNPITLEQAKQLPYLQVCLLLAEEQAVIYEGMRIRPPLIGLLPKVVPPGGDSFHGKFIPEGTAICMNVSLLLASTTLFGPNTNVFIPERFFEASRDKRVEMERNVELVFGYGQWGCVGKTVAFMELNKVIFELMRVFDFQLANPTEPFNPLSYGVFLEKMLVRVTESD